MLKPRFPLKGVAYPSDQAAEKAYQQEHWLPLTVGQILEKQAFLSPEKPFLIQEGAILSYKTFETSAGALARSLIEAGLCPGDRAIFQMGTTSETLIALFACYKVGIIPVCTLPQHRELEISSMIQLTNAKAYFIQIELDARFNLRKFANEMAKKHSSIEHVITFSENSLELGDFSLERANPKTERKDSLLFSAYESPSPRDVLTFQLSGGSTGVPKIIPRFHSEYLGQAQSIVRRFHLSESDVALWPLPLIHNAAMILIVLPILLSNGTLVLQKKFDLTTFLSAIEAHKVTFTGSIGPIAARLLDFHDFEKINLTSLRLFFALDRAESLEAHLNVPTVNLYGITEGLLMTCDPYDSADIRFQSTGYPTCFGDQIQVVNPETKQPVEEGAIGELCFRGPYTLCGYYNAPEINKESFSSDGFFYSGDLVRKITLQNKELYTFVGRLKDNISRGGEKFSAEEVECLITLHPAIADAKVVAMPDPYLGEKAAAFIILRSHHQALPLQELGDFLTQKGLARYKHPEHIELVESFPLTLVGKVDKVAMRHIMGARFSLSDSRSSP